MKHTNGGMIQRNKLMNLLDGIPEEQILYICAPAGYGKTVSIKQWLEQGGYNHALMSLDEFDNEPAHFCGRFCDALTYCQPDNKRLQYLTEHPGFDNAPAEFTARAVSALFKNGKVRLAIDDLHFVRDEKTLELLHSLLKRLPECFQIAIISRSELPPCFSELLLKSRITRIGADELRFNNDEIISLYKKRGISITQKKASEIQQFTYGWAIAIGALLLSGGEPLYSCIDPTEGNFEYLYDFIRGNVWQRWDENEREFMIKTSVVSELTPSLCTALTGIKDSGELLECLIRQNVFISRSKQGAYRYHRLFRDFLLNELARSSGELSNSLLEKAGYWYLSQRDFYNAVECFIKCESHKGIIKSFVFFAVIDRNSFIVDKLLPIFEQPVIRVVAEKFSYIYSAMAWAAFAEGRAADCAEYADKYYKKQLSTLRYDPRLAFYIFYMRIVDFRVTLRDIINMIEKIPKPVISVTASGAIPSIGIINQYMPLLHRGTRDFSECAEGDIETNVSVALKAIGHLFGDEANLLAHSLSSGLFYERGDLKNAYYQALAANAEIAEHFATETKFMAMSNLVYVYDALGQRDQAEETLNGIGYMIEMGSAYYLNYNFNALKTRRCLYRGDMDAARFWLTEYAASVYSSLDFYKLYGHITTCRAYITIGDYDSAAILLGKVLKLAEAYNRPLDIIEARILFSIVLWKKKDNFQSEAISHLEQALSLAHGYGFTQLFINDGAEISSMLPRIKRRAEQKAGENPPPPGFVKMLYLNTQGMPDTSMANRRIKHPDHLRFTAKQKNVMKLLAEGKSYRKISETLGITIPTLRSHLSAIYSKLGVTDGIDAIKKINASRMFDTDQSEYTEPQL